MRMSVITPSILKRESSFGYNISITNRHRPNNYHIITVNFITSELILPKLFAGLGCYLNCSSDLTDFALFSC